MTTTRQQRLNRSVWTIPLAYVAVAVFVGIVCPRLEHDYVPRLLSPISPAAAHAICSSIASGMIALTGIVFSLTFVMVQFSATAYSPRLVLWVARDPSFSHALGVFTATFLYALLFLAWVDRNGSGDVPLVGGLAVIGLLLASMGMFVLLIERIGLLQVSRMLIFIGNQGRRTIEEVYPASSPEGAAPATSLLGELPATQTVTRVGRPQVVQAVRIPLLVEMAAASGAIIEAAAPAGRTVMEGMALLRVYGASGPLDEQALRRGVQVGDERTFEQDPMYAIRLLVDIAIKALSPAINDPTTAVQALDQIEDLLLRLGRGHLDVGAYRDPQGKVRLVVPYPTWEQFLRLALDEIGACGATSVQVMRRMKAVIRHLLAVLPADRHPALERWDRSLDATIARSFASTEEQQVASVADPQGLGTGEEVTAPSPGAGGGGEPA
jgi:uncharacterized membrane protein